MPILLGSFEWLYGWSSEEGNLERAKIWVQIPKANRAIWLFPISHHGVREQRIIETCQTPNESNEGGACEN